MKIKLFTLPNFITCLNLVSGCIAILCAQGEQYFAAFYFILLAAVFDFFDGFAARMLKSYSEVGKELDSLADIVSFGVAPSMVIFHATWSATGQNYYAYIAFVLAAFSALRLAKFNIDSRQSEEFIGLPTPACALFASSLVATFPTLPGWSLLVTAGVLSVLLVSEVRMFSLKFKHFGLRENRLRYFFLLTSAVLLIGLHLKAFPIIIAFYVMISVIRNTSHKTPVKPA